MEKESIISILEDWNFWSHPFRDSFVRLSYETEVERKAGTHEILFLKGVRRSGKSTILLNHIKNLTEQGIPRENILFVNLEDPRFASSLSLDLLDNSTFAHKPKLFLGINA